METATVKLINTRPLIELYRFKKKGGSYEAITLIVFRLDNEVDLHGFNGEPSIAHWRELCEFLKPFGIVYVNALRHGELKRYRVR